MAKLRALWMVLVSGLSALALSGCITTLAPVQFLERHALASVNEVALAVGANGYKHYAWTECSGDDVKDPYTCVLVYVRIATGAVLYYYGVVTPIGSFYRYPDVAVTDSGDAYVVASLCTDFDDCVDYWTVFRAINPEGVEPIFEMLHGGLESEDPPVVAARGTDAYAAYIVEIGGYARLRYRQLTGGTRFGYIDSAHLFPSSPSLAVDSNGDLHAAWIRNPLTDTIVAYGNNIGDPDDFEALFTYEAGGPDDTISAPDLDLDDDNRPYIAYSVNTGAAEVVRVRCRDGLATNCYRDTTLLSVPTVDGAWNVYRDVRLAVIGDQPNVVFAAIHDSLSYNEIWWYHPDPDGGIDPPTRLTNTTNESEGPPLIVEENSTFGDVPVVAWRMYETLFADTQGLDGSYCWGDVYYTYGNSGTLYRVFQDRDTCGNGGFDLAARGEWVAGVWEDEESDVIESHAAWTTFNTLRTQLPLVTR